MSSRLFAKMEGKIIKQSKNSQLKNVVASGQKKNPSSTSGALSLSFFNYLQLQTYSQQLLTERTQTL